MTDLINHGCQVSKVPKPFMFLLLMTGKNGTQSSVVG